MSRLALAPNALVLFLAVAPPGAAAALSPPDAGPGDPSLAASETPATPTTATRLKLQLGAGAVAGLLGAPLSVGTAAWLGTLSSNLVLAALPAVLTLALLPPLLVTAAVVAAADSLTPGSGRWSPALWAATGVSVLVMTVAVLLNGSATRPADLAVYTLVQTLLLPTAAVGLMELTRKPAPASTSDTRAAPPEPRRERLPSPPTVTLAAWRFP